MTKNVQKSSNPQETLERNVRAVYDQRSETLGKSRSRFKIERSTIIILRLFSNTKFNKEMIFFR